MIKSQSARWRAGALAMSLLIAGCHAKPSAKTDPLTPKTDSAALEKATDPCANRMQDIVGEMYFYYARHGHMPDTLDQLKPYAQPGMDVTYTCPTSGEPYVYVPGGISANGIKDRLVLYDASPVHQGERWGVVMQPPLPNQVQMYVIELNDKLFKAYVPGQ